MRMQTDNESQQVKIKDLNDKQNVTVFSANVRGAKAFAAEQKNKRTQKEYIENKNNI